MDKRDVHLIGMVGRKQSGKTTSAQYLEKSHGYKKLALASPMKQIASFLFLWSPAMIEKGKETVDPIWGISPRQFLQYLGTEMMQYQLGEAFPVFKEKNGRGFWVNRLVWSIESMPSIQDMRLVISDVRFPHEVELLREAFSHSCFIRIVGRGETGDGHASETEQQQIEPDYELDNSGTILQLQERVSSILEEWKGSE